LAEESALFGVRRERAVTLRNARPFRKPRSESSTVKA
jgi:hypothetical protein